jgi:S-sulfosulfanyl-L-cysteine sulfohydrolase
MNRREFIDLLVKAGVTAGLAGCASLGSATRSALYEPGPWGDSRLLHITDTHAQLLPIHFREPNTNIGIGAAAGRWPHLVGRNVLTRLATRDPRQVHAFSCLDFTEAAQRFGKVGGFAHLKTLLDQLRAEVGGRALLLDGGDTWQGSGTALWTRGQDMVDACNLLGVEAMTGHWEFTYPDAETSANARRFKGDFIAQNVRATEDALFEGIDVHDEDTGHVFPPYVMKTVGGHRIAIIGQAFPYTPIANPQRFIPNWTFGIREAELQELVDRIRNVEKPEAVVLLSHNGMDVDLKLASRVRGIDFILGGHTHDGVPEPVAVDNPGGRTIVTNAGSNGKFVGVLDIAFRQGRVGDYRYRLLPVFANLLAPDASMQALIDTVRKPYLDRLEEPLAVTETLLFRRGNFSGTFDQVICDALREQLDAQISLSPGFRWGTTVLPGDTITMERVLDQTAMTYPETYVREMPGSEIHFILESVCDNLFHADPYLQQGGDMVRTGGLHFRCDPNRAMGERIDSLTLADGTPLDAKRNYKVAGWATVGSPSSGPPVWDVVASHLRDRKTIRLDRFEQPDLLGVSGNAGFEEFTP